MAEQVNEIPAEKYVEEVLASPKEYQPTTERGKRAKAKRDALKEPVKIAERMVDVTNCEKRLRAIAVKEKGKKSIDIWLTSILASLYSAKGIIDEYRNRWGVEVFFQGREELLVFEQIAQQKDKCREMHNLLQ